MTSDIWDQITGSLLFLVLGVALWTDLSTRLIPDRLTLPAGGIFLLLGLVKGDGWISLIGFFVCGGLLLLIALLSQGGMGGGDMKLAAAAGAALGWPTAIAGLIGGIFLGGVAGGILLLTGKAGRGFALPFAPFLLIGFGGGFFVGDWLIQWYLSFFA
ncbi:prepilin peptidase [Marininema mesophilum]|nr:prepilin peptidase [Marininema mesophilum]